MDGAWVQQKVISGCNDTEIDSHVCIILTLIHHSTGTGMGWDTLDGIPWMGYLGWDTLDGIPWMGYLGWDT